MNNSFWIKIYISSLDDPDVCLLSDRLWRRLVELNLLAGRHDSRADGEEVERGLLPDTRRIAFALRLQPAELETDLNELETAGFVTRESNDRWFLPDYVAQQAPVTPKERMAAMRERDKKPVTSRNRFTVLRVTSRNTDKIREDTDKIEKISSSSLPPKTKTGNRQNDDDGDNLLKRILSLNSGIEALGAKAVIDANRTDLSGFVAYLAEIEAAGIPETYTPGKIIATLKNKLPFTAADPKPEKAKNGGWDI